MGSGPGLVFVELDRVDKALEAHFSEFTPPEDGSIRITWLGRGTDSNWVKVPSADHPIIQAIALTRGRPSNLPLEPWSPPSMLVQPESNGHYEFRIPVAREGAGRRPMVVLHLPEAMTLRNLLPKPEAIWRTANGRIAVFFQVDTALDHSITVQINVAVARATEIDQSVVDWKRHIRKERRSSSRVLVHPWRWVAALAAVIAVVVVLIFTLGQAAAAGWAGALLALWGSVFAFYARKRTELPRYASAG